MVTEVEREARNAEARLAVKEMCAAHAEAHTEGFDGFWVWLWVDMRIACTMQELMVAAQSIARMKLEKFNPELVVRLRQLFDEKKLELSQPLEA